MTGLIPEDVLKSILEEEKEDRRREDARFEQLMRDTGNGKYMYFDIKDGRA